MRIDRRAASAALTSIILTLALTVCGFGCGDDDDPVAPQGAASTTRTVTVTVSEVFVIASCEGASDNPGDFTFEIEIAEVGKERPDWQQFSGSFSGLASQTIDIPDIVYTMEREPEAGDWFQVIFHVTEWDGADVVDDRMNDSMGEGYHAWTSGGDWDNGPHVTLVSGDTQCRVNMIYSVEVD